MSECVDLHFVVSSIVHVSELYFTGLFEVADHLSPQPCPVQAWRRTDNTNCKTRAQWRKPQYKWISGIRGAAQLSTENQQHFFCYFHLLSPAPTPPADRAQLGGVWLLHDPGRFVGNQATCLLLESAGLEFQAENSRRTSAGPGYAGHGTWGVCAAAGTCAPHQPGLPRPPLR